MGAGIVTVGKYRYAVGLYWENSPGGGRVTQIAKEAAQQPGTQAEFYVVRAGNNDGRVAQFGLCSGDGGHKAGMPVLASCLANQNPGSWAGAFRLSEGVVFVVVRDDLIVPDGDVFFRDEAEARDRLIQEIGFGGLVTIYAPESWSIPGADSIPLTLLLNERHDTKLQKVSIPKQTKIIAASVGFLIVIVLGGVWYWQQQVDAENAREAAAAKLKESLNPVLHEQKAPEPKYDRVWESKPPPMAVVEACRAGLASVPAALAGWKLTSIKCSGSTMLVSWGFDKGMTTIPDGATIDDTGKNASESITLADMPGRGSENLLDHIDIVKHYMAEGLNFTLALAPDDPLPPPPPGYTGEWHPPPAPWVKRSFTLIGAELPSNLVRYVTGIPGVVITGVSLSGSGSSGKWLIEGVIYENRK